MIIHKDKLPRRHDLDTVVNINPDEAGLFEQWLDEPLLPNDVKANDTPPPELMALLDSGLSSEAILHEVSFSKVGNDNDDYEAEVIGTPPDSPNWSVWSVLFVVKS